MPNPILEVAAIPGSAVMVHVGLNSSNVLSAGYDPRLLVMEVTFKTTERQRDVHVHGSRPGNFRPVAGGPFAWLILERK
jgi:hypothetical protein